MASSELRDRVILITGAGGGLGRSHSLACARLGAKVVVNDVDPAAAGATVTAVRDIGGEAEPAIAPVETEPGAASIVARALDRYGRLDAVVNNAGFLSDRTLAKLTPDRWDAVIAVHLTGSYLVTRAAWPHLRESGSGRVVMTSSHAGLVGNHGQSNYAAAKMGVVGLAGVLAIEGEASGIRVNTIAPLARTPQSENVWPPEVLARLAPAYASVLVAYLCSPACNETGAVFGLAGGTYVRHVIADAGRVTFDHVPELEELVARWNELSDPSPRSPTTAASINALLRGEDPSPV